MADSNRRRIVSYAEPTIIRSKLSPERVYMVGAPSAIPDLVRNLTLTDQTASVNGKTVRRGTLATSELPSLDIVYPNSANSDLLALMNGYNFINSAATEEIHWEFIIPADGTVELAPATGFAGFGTVANTLVDVTIEDAGVGFKSNLGTSPALTQITVGAVAADEYKVNVNMQMDFGANLVGCKANVRLTVLASSRDRLSGVAVGQVKVIQPLRLDDASMLYLIADDAYVSSANGFVSGDSVTLNFLPNAGSNLCVPAVQIYYGERVVDPCSLV